MGTVLIIIILLIFAYIFAVFPSVESRKAFPTDRFAHRGLHDERIPENSLMAFRAAKDAGLGVELDVQYTRDRKIVVCHDPDLKRVAGTDRRLIDMDYSEILTYPLCGTEERVPLFSDVLKIMAPLPVICEIKADNGLKNTSICPEVLEMMRDYPGFICVESFSPFIVEWFRKNAPDIMRGQLSMDDVKGKKGMVRILRFMLKEMLTNYHARPHFIAYRFTDKSLSLSLARLTRRVPLAGWTPKGRSEVKDACQRFDAVIFEKGGDSLEEIFDEDNL